MTAPAKPLSISQQRAKAKRAVASWNRKNPIGTEVSFEEFLGGGETHRSKTRTAATLMSHEAVVWIEAQGSCVLLTHCTVIKKVKGK